jgi:hypothetical protein
MAAPTPQITLTATLLDYSGNTIGTATAPAWLRIALCGFGQTLPTVPGAGNLAKVSSWAAGDIPFTGSQISVQLWGNDVVTPVGRTYYSISILDQNKNVVQSGVYQFIGTQTVDLSSAKQIINPISVSTGFVLVDTATTGPLAGNHWYFSIFNRTMTVQNVGPLGTPIANPVFIDRAIQSKQQISMNDGSVTITPVSPLMAAVTSYPMLDLATKLMESLSLNNGTFGVTP